MNIYLSLECLEVKMARDVLGNEIVSGGTIAHEYGVYFSATEDGDCPSVIPLGRYSLAVEGPNGSWFAMKENGEIIGDPAEVAMCIQRLCAESRIDGKEPNLMFEGIKQIAQMAVYCNHYLKKAN